MRSQAIFRNSGRELLPAGTGALTAAAKEFAHPHSEMATDVEAPAPNNLKIVHLGDVQYEKLHTKSILHALGLYVGLEEEKAPEGAIERLRW